MGLPNPPPRELYTPVRASTVAPEGDGRSVDEALARQREDELTALEHRLEVGKLTGECERVEEEAAERKTRSRVKRIMLWAGAFIGVAAEIRLVAWWVWLFFHHMSNFELIVSTASSVVSVCAGVAIYAASRFGKSKSDSSGAPEGVEAAKALRTLDEQSF